MSTHCPLSSPSVGIITENDHRVGNCLCALCTCSQHKCPCRPASRRSHSYETSYDHFHKRFAPKPIQRFAPYNPFLPPQTKFDGTTSMKTDFRPPSSVELMSTDTKRSITPVLSFVGSSSYSKDYPDWGPSHPVQEKRPILPLRLRELKFHGQSTYKQDFESLRLRPQIKDSARLSRGKRSKSYIGLENLRVDKETTTQRHFKAVASSAALNQRVMPKAERPVFMKSPPCHHVTTSFAAFQPIAISASDNAILRRRKAAKLRQKTQE